MNWKEEPSAICNSNGGGGIGMSIEVKQACPDVQLWKANDMGSASANKKTRQDFKKPTYFIGCKACVLPAQVVIEPASATNVTSSSIAQEIG